MVKIVRNALLLFLSLLSFQRNAIWDDDCTLWTDATIKSPSKARGYNELGLYALTKGRYSEALRAIARTIQMDPYQPVAYINIGLAYEKLQQIDLAVQAYEKAITLDPGDPTAYYNLGVVHYNYFKDRNKALPLLLKARDLNPLEPDVHNYLGKIYREQGDDKAAQKEFSLYQTLR